MARSPLSEAIPDLELSPSEQHDVIEKTAAVLAETLDIERQFLVGRGSLRKSEWKQVRGGRGDFRLFRERRRSQSQRRVNTADMELEKVDTGLEALGLEEVDWPDTSSVNESLYSDSISGSFVSDSVPLRFLNQLPDDTVMSNTSSSHSSGGASVTPTSDYARIPMVVSAGQVDGNLEDVLFGWFGGDDRSWQLRSAYIKDKYTDARILSTVLAPTPEDPYRFLGVKWFARQDSSLVFGTLIKDRDFLVIEATGLTRDENGVPHGYYIMHSYRHPLVPEFSDRKILRCELSLCYISRQVGPNKVHIFNRGFIDPKGIMPPSIAITISANALSGCAKSVETSLSKKLMWLVEQHKHDREQLESQRNEAMSSRTCEVCNKTVRFLTGNLSFCHVCGLCACSNCTVQRRLVVDISASGVLDRVLSFCSTCVLTAKQLPPHQVAADTLSLTPQFLDLEK
ncbi:hypothetical protein Poli38472_012548 [Pythium oligandrum]|uniref:FYVE-type domain-containing protein n=1 Tax=Pythium oligandrum TaxID=41045 RepID=A0A8K1CDN1_PYTOL|nr:hypothetical protein Poli38472_012548 [Pythium oligandrum]|eukprot:TMW61357.1 hypothetical protein Poli38472_012548 [Pythium oligandrum]